MFIGFYGDTYSSASKVIVRLIQSLDSGASSPNNVIVCRLGSIIDTGRSFLCTRIEQWWLWVMSVSLCLG